jgi:LPS export ABC transporter permease LptG
LAEAAALSPGRLRRARPSRPGLLDFYLIRGVAGPFLVITAAVCSAMMLERALRLIHELAGRGADLGYFLPILLQLVPYYLDLAIPAAFMVAIMLLVARLDDNLELEAMLASGLSMSRLAAPLVVLGLAIAAAGLITAGWLEPHGRYGFRSLRAEAVNAGRIGQLQPRAIYHPTDNLALTFDTRGPGGRVGGIFVWQLLPDGRELVLTGQSGRIGFAAEERAFGIDLGRGHYVARRPGQPSPDLIAFDGMAFRESLKLQDSSWRRGWDHNELTLPELAAAVRDGDSAIPQGALEVELYGRLARAAVIPLIPLIVLPLAFTTKKGRRGIGILIGGVLLAAFHHGMNFARQLALTGAVDPLAATLAATAVCVSVALLLFVSGRKLPSHSPIHNLLRPLTAASSPFRPKERRAPGLKGRTLGTYFAWRFATWVLLSLLAIILLLQMVDLLERGEEFVERGLGLGGVAYYAWLQLPLMLQQAVPIAALAAAMVVFIALGRTSEMTAIRAAGISQWRILLMALPVPVILSAAAFFLSEHAVPRSQLALAAWWAETAPAGEAPEEGSRWFRVGDEIVQAQGASPDGRRLSRVEIFRRGENGLLRERLAAASAVEEAGRWILVDVEVSRFGPGMERSHSAQLDWVVPVQPQDVAAFFSSVRSLSSSAAQRALGAEAPVSQGETLFATRIMRSAAEPLAPIVMLLLALPLAFVAPRTGVAWPALLYAAAGGLLYLVADGVLTVFAQVGYLPPAVGAWAAPGIVLLSGVTVLLYTER